MKLEYNTILDILQSISDCTKLDTIRYKLINPDNATRIQNEQDIIDYTLQQIKNRLDNIGGVQ